MRKLSLVLYICILMGSTLFAAERDKEEGVERLSEVELLLDQKIPTRDGILLSANIYKPKKDNNTKDSNDKEYPTVVYMTPYINEHADNRGWYLAQRGFVFIAVDVRGRGNSQGDFKPFIQEAKDGYDIIEWSAQQSWSSGKVGMLGGSYVGYTQWATIKEFPPHLKTIMPIASVGPGIDFPMKKNIGYPYSLKWLTTTSGKTGLNSMRSSGGFWDQVYKKYYHKHMAFKSLPEIANSPDTFFIKWLEHPTFDSFWKQHHPTEEDYKKINIPILTITGFYDGDQPGAMNYYKNHMRYGSKAAKNKHYLILGPWDHGGTRRPKEKLKGLEVGNESVIDMLKLYEDWFNWTLKDGKKPELLKDKVAYYTIGENEWRYAKSYSNIGEKKQKFYLSSENNDAKDVFNSGALTQNMPAMKAESDFFISDPLANTEDQFLWYERDYTDQKSVMAMNGDGLIYHSKPFEADQEIAGQVKVSLSLSMDVLDTDIQVRLYQVRPDGSSIFLAKDMIRARYRNSIEKEQLVEPGEINKYVFDDFFFYAKKISKGSRLRLIVASRNAINYQKNYNAGGVIADETGKDAEVATIKLHQNAEHTSYLELPLEK